MCVCGMENIFRAYFSGQQDYNYLLIFNVLKIFSKRKMRGKGKGKDARTQKDAKERFKVRKKYWGKVQEEKIK